MYMKLTWTTILIFDVHFDVQFNGTPQMRDAVLILNHSIYMYYITLEPVIAIIQLITINYTTKKAPVTDKATRA